MQFYALGGDASTEAQLELAGRPWFDHQAVAADMPSYQHFKASHLAAIDEVRRPRRRKPGGRQRPAAGGGQVLPGLTGGHF